MRGQARPSGGVVIGLSRKGVGVGWSGGCGGPVAQAPRAWQRQNGAEGEVLG